MAKKHNKNEGFSYEDRLDMLFGSGEPTQPKPEKKVPQTLREAVVQSMTCDVDEEEDYETQSPLSVTKPIDIDEAKAIMGIFGLTPDDADIAESTDTVEDVLGQIGITPAKPVKIATPMVESEKPECTCNCTQESDVGKNCKIRFSFNPKTHVAEYTDGVRTYTVAIDMLMYSDCTDLDNNDAYNLTVDAMIYTSVPIAAIDGFNFRSDYLTIFKFDKDKNYRFSRIDGTDLTFCYVIDPTFKDEFDKAYQYADSCGKSIEFCSAILSMITNASAPANYADHLADSCVVKDIMTELSQYGRTPQLFREIVKSDEDLDELENAEYSGIPERTKDIFADLTDYVRMEYVDDEKDDEDDDDDEPIGTVNSLTDDDAEEDPDVLPSDKEENDAILAAFGKNPSEPVEIDGEDKDDDISKFLKDDDDNDDGGESFIMNVKE